ncbi:EEF1A lysine methyltransferase 2 isoform X3 [Chlorocebus sabaeus]|uniref:EEF1A lysine methyltransferase 2 isoform X3 n=1 Tax=Chlorocebus sabaeus TaxID=60711 RepID=UPI0018B04751|nr:EEF1A lysine methyltransferase 2 isoform X1 [Chlorocebus sabaeus]XP_037865609.1 EEF1A lysine methyltransferase 2 isoform X1 [Chlorocebus sabaeus]
MSWDADGGSGAEVAALSDKGSPGEDGFVPSALGTREHWDAVYERELQTFREFGDTGEIWFGEESMNRLIRWMQKHKIPLDASVLDIGTGNGVFLVELAKFGFSDITGIDYSPSAIQLSGSVIEKEGLSNIKLKVEDFLNLSTQLSGFHICIDKGTFDAISLNPDNAIEKRKQYVKSLSRVLKVKGFFLITSCNWTKEELLNEFSEGLPGTSCPCSNLMSKGLDFMTMNESNNHPSYFRSNDLNFSKSCQHPSSALEADLETV